MQKSDKFRVRETIEVIKVAVKEVISSPFMPEFSECLVSLLKEHGCSVSIEGNRWRIAFPDGTVRSEIFPRCYDERYLITLPDGYTISERLGRSSQLSYLSFHIDDIPLELRNKHKEIISQMTRL